LNLVELARQCIAIDSSVSHGTKDFAQFLAKTAEEWGLRTECVEESLSGLPQTALIISDANLERNNAKKNLILSTRMDTPDPGSYAQWVKTGANPYNASVSGESIYGLGAADCKLDLMCKLVALREVKGRNLKSRPLVVGAFGRESGASTIRLLRKKLLNPAAALVGAPTGLQISNRAPGFARVEISLPLSAEETKYLEEHNQAEGSHSQSKIFSRPHVHGTRSIGIHENPIIKLIEYLKMLPKGVALLAVDGGASAEIAPDLVELEIDLVGSAQGGVCDKLIKIGESIKALAAELKSVTDASFSPGHSTLNLGMIRMYPEEIKLTGVCRLIPAADENIYGRWLERLRQDCVNAGAKFQILDFKPPFMADEQNSFFGFLKGVSSKSELRFESKSAPISTEANVYHRLGVQCALFGPGEPPEIESAAFENIAIKDLDRAVVFYKSVIENFDAENL
jgi:acetylornithine deacetylase/succinyl-diaminopimelate desuccinylase-like protein